MRIVGLGIDVIEVARMERLWARHGERFTRRFCRQGEVRPRRGAARIQHLAGLFAAKEAVLKVLGTGWGQGVSFRQVEVVRAEGGAPAVRLHERAAAVARDLGIDSVRLSITHESTVAAAVALGVGSE